MSEVSKTLLANLLRARDQREIFPFETIIAALPLSSQKQSNTLESAEQQHLANRVILLEKIAQMTTQLQHKNSDLNNLIDEINVLKLELALKDGQYEKLCLKILDMQSENQLLIQRIVKMKEDQVSKLNEVNEFVETSLRSRPISQQHPGEQLFDALVDLTLIFFQPHYQIVCSMPYTTNCFKKFPAHDDEIHCVQISKDGNLLATGSQDKRLNLYDTKTLALQRSLTGSLQGIMSVAFSSEMVLGTSSDNSIKIWNLNTFRLVHSLTGHIGKVYSARFGDGNKVISGSHDRTIKVWDLTKAYCKFYGEVHCTPGAKTLFTMSSCNDLAPMDSEGTVIASGHLDSNLRFWDTRSGILVKECSNLHSGQITSVEVSDAGYHILTTSRDNTLKLIDARMYEVLQTYTNPDFKVGMNWTKSCLSPDASYVASGSSNGSLYIWDTLSAKLEKVLREHSSAICGVVWSPNGGSTMYSAEKDRSVVVYH